MKKISIHPLHHQIYSQEIGQWVWLPGSEWKIQFFPSRIIAKHLTAALSHDLSWPAEHWIDHFEIALDLNRARLKVIIHEPYRKIHISVFCINGLPAWRLERLSTHKKWQGSCSLIHNEHEVKKYSLESPATDKTVESLKVVLDGRSLPLSLGDCLRADAVLNHLELLNNPPNHSVQLWFGLNKKLHWSSILLRQNPFEIAPLLLAASRWLPKIIWQEGLSSSLNLISPYSSEWSKIWMMQVKKYLKDPMLCDFEDFTVSSDASYDFLDPLKRLALLSHTFLDQWISSSSINLTKAHSVLRLCSDASRRVACGRIVGYETIAPKASFSWQWQKERSWMIQIQAAEEGLISLELYPKPKSCRLRVLGDEKELKAQGKFLDVELKPGANYQLDRFVF
jgi:hypothetical protein